MLVESYKQVVEPGPNPVKTNQSLNGKGTNLVDPSPKFADLSDPTLAGRV